MSDLFKTVSDTKMSDDSSNESDSSTDNLTEEEEEEERTAVKRDSDSDIPQPRKGSTKISKPPKPISRQPMDEYDMTIRTTAEECATLYAELKTYVDERKVLNKKINDIKGVIQSLESQILRYLSTPDEMGRVPPNVPVKGGGTFYVTYKDRVVKMDKEEKISTFANTLKAKQKEIGKNSLQVAEEIFKSLVPKHKVAKLEYK